MTQPTPAGWFPDPSDPSRLRYFDGRTWTEQYTNFGGPRPPASQSSTKGSPSGKKVALIAGGIVLGLLVIGSLTNNDDKKPAATSSGSSYSKSYETRTAPTTSSGPTMAPAGSSVRDGKFEFKVLGVQRGGTSKDGGFGTTDTAKGEYFTVKLQVTNIGDEARTLFASNQKLIINGKTYEATSHITDDGWKEDINPGLASTTTATFDIPPGAVPTAIECHDSAFSGGALLAL